MHSASDSFKYVFKKSTLFNAQRKQTDNSQHFTLYWVLISFQSYFYYHHPPRMGNGSKYINFSNNTYFNSPVLSWKVADAPLEIFVWCVM